MLRPCFLIFAGATVSALGRGRRLQGVLEILGTALVILGILDILSHAGHPD